MPNKPLSDAQVATEVQHFVSSNRIGWTRHAEQMMALRGIDKGQIKECLRRGVFTERPTIPNRSGNIEYTFRIEAMVDHETIIVAASLIPAKKVVVITVFPDK